MKPSILNRVSQYIWALLWLMLPLWMRGTAFVIWLFGMVIVVQLLFFKPRIRRREMWFAGLFLLFFIIHVVSLVLDPDPSGWTKTLERKAVLLVIPLLMLVGNETIPEREKWAIRGFLTGLAITGIHLIVMAVKQTWNSPDYSHWMYHQFAGRSHLGAIYLSWYLSSALLYLLFRKQEPEIQKYRILIVLFFLLLLLLASSKLFILLTIPLLIWKILKERYWIKGRLITVTSIILGILLLSIPFYQRLGELKNTNLSIVNQSSYTYDTPFNGITIRLLQWRFGLEILSENKSWITGTGINSKQQLLNDKYRQYGVYTGNPKLGDRGYLDYNFHNQYVETLVGTGIVGLFLLLLLIISIFVRSRFRLLFPIPVYILTAMFFFTESVLERQAGIVFFTLIACTLSDAGNKE